MRNPPDEALGATDDLPSSPPASGRGPKGGHPASAKNKGAGGSEPNPSRVREGDEDAPIRKCILSGERDVRPHLVRLALAPDGQIHPDVRAKAPGRGAWIGVTRVELEAAIKKGKLKGALARAFKTGEFAIPPELPAQIEAALERNALDRLGLESRSGTVLIGSDRIEQNARQGKLKALYHASDAAEDGNRKLDQAWRIGNDVEGSGLRGLALPASRTILALALGRENVVHIGLTDRAAAKRVSEALDRWLHFIGPEPSPVSCETASQGASASQQNGTSPITGASGSTGHSPAVDMTEEFE
jgi:predicted RNA-binding protein YlxR (DUF448 family)